MLLTVTGVLFGSLASLAASTGTARRALRTPATEAVGLTA